MRRGHSAHNDGDLIKLTLDNPYEGLVIVNTKGIITYFSKSNEKIFNKKREEAVGKHVTEVIPNTRLHIVAKTGKAEIGEVMLVGNEEKIVGRFPLKKNGKIIGAVGKVIFYAPDKFIRMAAKVAQLQEEIELYQRNINACLRSRYTFDDIIGRSERIRSVKESAKRCANSSSTVLITGETGTGKELLAHAIHDAGIRRHGPFVKLNCAAIPAELIESELFGYEEGAFTGARRKGKLGKFELAKNGTIFLDEIAEMPLQLQPKLLRVLQDKEIEKIGANHPVKINFRLIAATNKDLAEEVRKGSFREDLFYRLNVITLNMPPLREMRDDIPLLVEKILTKMAFKLKVKKRRITEEAEKVLMDYDWPGNIRELENVIEAAVNMSEGDVISIEHLPPRLVVSNIVTPKKLHTPKIYEEAMREAKREIIKAALRYTNNNKAKAAKFLGIRRSKLYYNMKKIGLD